MLAVIAMERNPKFVAVYEKGRNPTHIRFGKGETSVV